LKLISEPFTTSARTAASRSSAGRKKRYYADRGGAELAGGFEEVNA
jgi:hypothetical protein